MALVVEDGTGRADAESYGSVADATAYHTKMGNAAWGALADDTVREQALRRATRHMVAVYRQRWMGQRATANQALDWPRYNVRKVDAPGGIGDEPAYYANTEIPPEVVEACFELALRTGGGTELLPDLGRTVKERTVGPVKTVFEDSAPEGRRFQLIDNLLQPFLRGGGLSVGRLTRA